MGARCPAEWEEKSHTPGFCPMPRRRRRPYGLAGPWGKMAMNKEAWTFAPLAVAVLTGAPAMAQNGNDGWKASATTYLWATAYDNTVKDAVTGQSSKSSASFGDILGNLRSVPLLAKGEVQYDRVGVYADFIYLPLSDSRTVNRPVLGPITSKADLTTTTLTLAGFYRVAQSDQLNVDLLAGLRYVKLSFDLDVSGPGAGFSRDPSGSITEAIIGARATQRVGPRSSLTVYGDYGGFSSSRTVWQLEGTFDYQWTPKLGVSAGYRHYVVELEKGRLSTDVRLSGPVVGLTYRF